MKVNQILHNPNYTDAYVYYRKKVSAADDWQPRVVELLPRSAWKITPDHHTGYISWTDWEENVKLLASRRATRSSIAKSPALLDRIIWCASCDREIRPKYDMRVGDRRLPAYRCRPANREGEIRRCVSAAASAVDRLVEQELLKALTPAGIDSALAAIDEVLAERRALGQTQQRLVQRAKDEADDLYQRYRHVDLDNPPVKRALEIEYRKALERYEEVKTQAEEAQEQRDVPLERSDVEELMARAADLRAVWAAPTTSHEDRKRLVRAAIRRVWIIGRTEEATEIEIEWVGGLRERHRALRPKGIDQIVLELVESGCRNVAEVARALRARGVLNSFGRPISKLVIWTALKRLGHHREPNWVRALLVIREMVLDHRSNREIRARLKAEGVRHWLGEWTPERVGSAIGRLRSGRLPDGVASLPADARRRPSVGTPLEAVEIIRHGRAGGRSWEAIVADLKASEFRTATGREFTVPLARALYCCWKHRGLVP